VTKMPRLNAIRAELKLPVGAYDQTREDRKSPLRGMLSDELTRRHAAARPEANADIELAIAAFLFE